MVDPVPRSCDGGPLHPVVFFASLHEAPIPSNPDHSVVTKYNLSIAQRNDGYWTSQPWRAMRNMASFASTTFTVRDEVFRPEFGTRHMQKDNLGPNGCPLSYRAEESCLLSVASVGDLPERTSRTSSPLPLRVLSCMSQTTMPPISRETSLFSTECGYVSLLVCISLITFISFYLLSTQNRTNTLLLRAWNVSGIPGRV